MSETNNESPMSISLKSAVAAWIAGLNIGLTFTLAKLWPVTGSPGVYSPDGRFLLMAAVAGALGSCIHLASSFVDYAGKSGLTRQWGWWYLLRPGIGAALAVVIYFVIHAGLISGAGDAATGSLNPYGVCGVAALSGMFSRQATEKLKEVFDHLCATNSPQPE